MPATHQATSSSTNPTANLSLRANSGGRWCPFEDKMNDPINTQPAYVQSGETLNVLANMINADHATNDKSARDSALRAKQIGDRLNEAKSRLPHGGWLDWLAKNICFNRQQAALYMKVAANWANVSPGLHLAGIYKMLAEETKEEEPPPANLTVTPAVNPPLCFKCARLVRTSQPPTKGCRDCKSLREEAAQVVEEEPNEEEAAEEPEEEAPPDKPKPPKVKSGTAIPTTEDFTKACSLLLKQIDIMAHAVGLKKANRNGQADSVIETPEVMGFRRIVDELQKVVKKWYDKQKPRG